MDTHCARPRRYRYLLLVWSGIGLTGCPQLLDNDFQVTDPGTADPLQSGDVANETVQGSGGDATDSQDPAGSQQDPFKGVPAAEDDATGGSSEVTQICPAGTRRCDAAELMACNSLGTEWVLAETYPFCHIWR